LIEVRDCQHAVKQLTATTPPAMAVHRYRYVNAACNAFAQCSTAAPRPLLCAGLASVTHAGQTFDGHCRSGLACSCRLATTWPSARLNCRPIPVRIDFRSTLCTSTPGASASARTAGCGSRSARAFCWANSYCISASAVAQLWVQMVWSDVVIRSSMAGLLMRWFPAGSN